MYKIDSNDVSIQQIKAYNLVALHNVGDALRTIRQKFYDYNCHYLREDGLALVHEIDTLSVKFFNLFTKTYNDYMTKELLDDKKEISNEESSKTES